MGGDLDLAGSRSPGPNFWSAISRRRAGRSLVFLQRDVKGVDGFEVEVVGRLVEDEKVGLQQHELAEEQARGLAAGECGGGLKAFFAAEEHLAEDAADVFGGGFGVELPEPVEGGGAGLDDAGVVLGK